MKTLFIGLILLLSIDSYASNRTEKEMRTIAYNNLCTQNYHSKRSGPLGQMQLTRIVEEETYCIYEASNVGFVIVSRNDAFPPVLGISYSSYQQENMPDGFKWWLNAISERMAEGRNFAAFSLTPQDNFITTTWGQDDPYNGMCPKIGTSRPPTGCLATAMAQIMKYYQYPAKGKGTGKYTIGKKTKTVATNKEYQWDKMDDSYNSSSTMLNKVAVQYIMADAGAAAGITYAMSGSSAYISDAATAIADNFQYDSLSLHYLNRFFYSDAEWMEIAYKELSQSHPILYGGNDRSYGGHAFVLSGIDAEGKVYVNWGWEGLGDGYYDFADLSPVDGTKKMSYTFDLYQEMIVGFRTSFSASSYGFMSQWVCEEPYTLRTRDINLVELGFRSLWNMHIISFTGVVDLYFDNMSGGNDDSLILYDTDEDGIVFSQYGFLSEDDDLIKIPIILEDLDAGSYKVYLRTKDKRETTPQVVRVSGGVYSIELTKNADGSIVTSSDAIPEPSEIEQIKSGTPASSEPIRFFNLQGQEVNGSQKGLLIRKQGNEMKKVMVK